MTNTFATTLLKQAWVAVLKKKALIFVLSSLLFTATVLEPIRSTGPTASEITKQPLVHDWSVTSEALCDVNRHITRNTEGKFVQGVKQ